MANSVAFEKHCWVEIDLDALIHNYQVVQARAGQVPVCAVVKADAYGHGDLMVAKTLSKQGVRRFAVSCLAEARHLRTGGVHGDILILGYTPPEYAADLSELNLTQTLLDAEYAALLSQRAQEAGCMVKCHLKLDTGMGRIGFALRSGFDQAIQEAAACFALPGLDVCGAFQHFAVADSLDEDDEAYTAEQYNLFCRAVEALQAKGLSFSTHCCNSAGQILHPEWNRDMVRAGIILYGHTPSDEVAVDELQPVMTLKAVVSQVKALQPGQSVSYGRTFTAQQPLKVATVCCGYADGYPRLLSDKGMAAVNGQPAPIIGRVCMDQLLIDVTHISQVVPGDEVCLFGGNGPQDTVAAAAAKAGTIHYELLCGITNRVPRLYKQNGQPVALLNRLADAT